jgi:ATP synthase protein I
MPIFDKDILKNLWVASTVGLNFVLSTTVGYFMGRGIDYLMKKWFGWDSAPWFTIIFLLLGIVTGFRELFRIAKKIQNESDKKDL